MLHLLSLPGIPLRSKQVTVASQSALPSEGGVIVKPGGDRRISDGVSRHRTAPFDDERFEHVNREVLPGKLCLPIKGARCTSSKQRMEGSTCFSQTPPTGGEVIHVHNLHLRGCLPQQLSKRSFSGAGPPINEQ